LSRNPFEWIKSKYEVSFYYILTESFWALATTPNDDILSSKKCYGHKKPSRNIKSDLWKMGVFMRVHVDKKAIRVLGISESFIKGVSKDSILAGVVIRADMIVDGFSFSKASVGGMDATASIMKLVKRLNRDDVNLLMLNGCVISWFNVVDLDVLLKELKLPLICITYEKSDGLERYFKKHFKDWAERMEIHKKNGEREVVKLHTGHELFALYRGMGRLTARRIINKFTLQGAVPEPLRVSRLAANSLLNVGAIPSD
jgi:uncharacterized protein